MRQATILVHGSANDLLPPGRRQHEFTISFELPAGVRDLIQATGIPHVELESVVRNGRPIDYTDRVDDGDQLLLFSKYPLSHPPESAAFILDVHLGRLAHYLRLFGIDTAHDPHTEDAELARRSVGENRILLTRDRHLLMRAELKWGSYVRSTDAREQIREVIGRFALRRLVRPLTRCLECNGVLEPADRLEARGRIPEGVWQRHQDLSRCASCNRTYWKGSHYSRMLRLVDETLAGVS
jgi:uncharacterized protein with PIN domain